jgi:hypothetical protein
MERLELRKMQLCPSLIKALVSYDRLQVLTITSSSSSNSHAQSPHPQPQLCTALNQLTQLCRLGWELYLLEWQLHVETLLESLPASLQAMDLRIPKVTSGTTTSSSSLAHLVHLTSLRLWGVDLLPPTSMDDPQQQQQQQQQQQTPAPGLVALSMRPWGLLGWFAAPSVVALEVERRPNWAGKLRQLAGCPRLRQLRLKCRAISMTADGVSALTQLTQLSQAAGRCDQAAGGTAAWEVN